MLCIAQRFVSIGQSQGGGAVWGIAHLSASSPVTGYLGGVAISPYVGLLEDNAGVNDILAANTLPATAALFSGLQIDNIVTAEGKRQVYRVHELDAGISSAFALLTDVDIFQGDWKENQYLREYQNFTSNGGKAIGSPLFIAHGTADPCPHDVVTQVPHFHRPLAWLDVMNPPFTSLQITLSLQSQIRPRGPMLCEATLQGIIPMS